MILAHKEFSASGDAPNAVARALTVQVSVGSGELVKFLRKTKERWGAHPGLDHQWK